MQPGARRRPYTAAAALSRWQIIAQVEECAPPSVSGRQAGLEWHAGARMGARAAILDCEASICNRELAAAPTPQRPRLPMRRDTRVDSRLLREFIPPSAPYSPRACHEIHIGLVYTSAQRDQYLQPPSSWLLLGSQPHWAPPPPRAVLLFELRKSNRVENQLKGKPRQEGDRFCKASVHRHFEAAPPSSHPRRRPAAQPTATRRRMSPSTRPSPKCPKFRVKKDQRGQSTVHDLSKVGIRSEL